MINAHKASKDAYGGEIMPEGTADCNSCGWHGKKENFKYGLCNSCAPDESEESLWREKEDERRYCNW